jgi:hypothetical protein
MLTIKKINSRYCPGLKTGLVNTVYTVRLASSAAEGTPEIPENPEPAEVDPTGSELTEETPSTQEPVEISAEAKAKAEADEKSKATKIKKPKISKPGHLSIDDKAKVMLMIKSSSDLLSKIRGELAQHNFTKSTFGAIATFEQQNDSVLKKLEALRVLVDKSKIPVKPKKGSTEPKE